MKNKAISTLLLLYLFCSGCAVFSPQKDNSKFYTLGDHSVSGVKFTEIDRKVIVINLLLDEIPSYADYPYIVTKSETNELIFSENSRWAEPFGDACIRVILEKLSAVIGDRVVIVSSMHTIGNTLICDYRISIDFDDVIYNEKEKSIVVKCVWSFFDQTQRRQICLHKYAKATAINAVTVADIVDGTRIALCELAENISEKICQLGVLEKKVECPSADHR
ncbi:MAG: ABC-type transport auxiliary lipoprotein family protein [Puniceicoccales bacterium]|jgi:uncharacterized lipoprotein YmbA|nr:ABC-type transport auxiliary lipoprotein family protein [Puniceicoccales bacterium]